MLKCPLCADESSLNIQVGSLSVARGKTDVLAGHISSVFTSVCLGFTDKCPHLRSLSDSIYCNRFKQNAEWIIQREQRTDWERRKMTHVGLITSFCLSAPINNSGHRGHKGQVTEQFTDRQRNREAQEGLVCFVCFFTNKYRSGKVERSAYFLGLTSWCTAPSWTPIISAHLGIYIEDSRVYFKCRSSEKVLWESGAVYELHLDHYVSFQANKQHSWGNEFSYSGSFRGPLAWLRLHFSSSTRYFCFFLVRCFLFNTLSRKRCFFSLCLFWLFILYKLFGHAWSGM